jgi:hypothetical protein
MVLKTVQRLPQQGGVALRDKGGEAFKVSKEGGFISWAVTPNLVRQVRQFM